MAIKSAAIKGLYLLLNNIHTTLVLVILLLHQSRSADLKTKVKENAKEVEATLRLLAEGETKVDLRDDLRDLVLVLGNTGAGKSTITKFITTDLSDMEAYDAGGRILIRDRAGLISVNSTAVSKTIFPTLFIHPKTNTAFYDLPGFSDTRSPYIEIANTFFMRKVAEHAKRVKLLFIVNHSSLRPGDSQTDFTALVKHAIQFIGNVEKFGDGIALVASKVESPEPTNMLIRWIENFLQIYSQQVGEAAEARKFIDSILRSGQGHGQGHGEELADVTSSRIGLFRQPVEVGPLNQIEKVQKVKADLEKLVLSDLRFVETTPGDFKSSVSNDAKLLIKDVADRLSEKIGESMEELAVAVERNFENMSSGVENLTSLLIDLKNQYDNIKSTADILLQAGGRTEFVQTMRTRFSTFPGGENKNSTLLVDSIIKSDEYLRFIEGVLKSDIPSRPFKWVRPLEDVAKTLGAKVWTVAEQLSADMLRATTAVAKDLENFTREKIRNKTAETDTESLYKLLNDCNLLNATTFSAVGSATFGEFIQQTVTGLSNLTVLQVSSATLSSLARQSSELRIHTIFQGRPLPFKIDTWVQPLGAFLIFLLGQIYQLSNSVRQENEKKLAQTFEAQFRQKAVETERAWEFARMLEEGKEESMSGLTEAKEAQQVRRREWRTAIRLIKWGGGAKCPEHGEAQCWQIEETMISSCREKYGQRDNWFTTVIPGPVGRCHCCHREAD